MPYLQQLNLAAACTCLHANQAYWRPLPAAALAWRPSAYPRGCCSPQAAALPVAAWPTAMPTPTAAPAHPCCLPMHCAGPPLRPPGPQPLQQLAQKLPAATQGPTVWTACCCRAARGHSHSWAPCQHLAAPPGPCTLVPCMAPCLRGCRWSSWLC
jgi:hypothetical protein